MKNIFILVGFSVFLTSSGAQVISASNNVILFLGSEGKIGRVLFDFQSSTASRLPDVSFTDGLVGWMAYDEVTDKLFAASESGEKMDVFEQVGQGTQFQRSFHFLPETVHLNIIRDLGSLFFIGASYNRGKIAIYQTHSSGNSIQLVGSQSFGSAHTHSTAFDERTGFLAVANLSTDEVRTFKFSQGKLSALGVFRSPRPRTIVFDEVFEKFYLASESTQGKGSIKILEAQANQGLSSLASVPFGLEGSDIKINREFRLAMALQRESGNEALVFAPLTAQGALDTNRSVKSQRVPCRSPRALETKSNFFFVACESSGINFLIFKMQFDIQGQFLGAKQIFGKSFGAAGLNSILLVDLK